MNGDRGEAGRSRGTRRRSDGPTVADVARVAGVSPMTVSRVINREANVLPATREKVERAVSALGYVPNAAARSLAGGRQARIVLLYGNPSAAYLSEFLVGSLGGADEEGAQLVIERWHPEEEVDAVARRLAGQRVDAILLPPPLCEDPALLAALAAAKIPYALVAAGKPAADAPAVIISDEDAAHAMTRHLIELGHRRIGFIAGDANQSASALRLAGYRRALDEAEIAADAALIREGDFTYRSGLTAAEALLALDPRPTAIFASNDDMAAAAVAVAHRRHLDVPRDVSVAGFDDTAMATTIWPELTTIRQPVAEMARGAIRLLTDEIQARRAGTAAAPRHERLDFALVIRGSAAPPA